MMQSFSIYHNFMHFLHVLCNCKRLVVRIQIHSAECRITTERRHHFTDFTHRTANEERHCAVISIGDTGLGVP